MNFEFAWPLCFLLFVPLALAAWRMLRRGRRAGVKFAPMGRLPAKTAGWRAKVANLSPWFFLAGAALLVVAAARPRSSFSRSSRSVDAIAIAMAVDVSGSMLERDFMPEDRLLQNERRLLNELRDEGYVRLTQEQFMKLIQERSDLFVTRLGVVKEMFAKFIEARPNDLIGLVTFGTYASENVPLTAEHELLQQVLKNVRVSENNGNTAIGDGLLLAIDRLKYAEPKSKIVILLSDGMSNEGEPPDVAAEAAKARGIRVYTIGVAGSKEDNNAFDRAQLESIAEKTDARYFHVRDEEGLKAALEEINKLETTPLDSTVYQRWQEHFAQFLLPGALLVLFAVTLQMVASRRLV